MDLENATKDITTAATNMVTNVKNAATAATASAQNLVANAVVMPTNANPNSGNGLFDMAGKGAAFKDFMDSNSIVARIAFLLLVIFIFIVVLQISIRLMVYFFKTTDTPYLIYGQVDASTAIVFPQDTKLCNAHQIPVSVNRASGIEFTWSIWIFIKPPTIPDPGTKYYHIFSKGNMNFPTANNGLATPNNGPGLYLKYNTSKNQYTLLVIMDSISTPGINSNKNQATILSIPTNKWVNVIIRCKGSTIDVYINGTITKSVELTGIPKQNYGPVYVAMNGGFDGYISNLWYYDYALGIADIQSLVKKGPSLTMRGLKSINLKNPDYLSLRWYFKENANTITPP